MTIEIHQPELEALITERLQTGGFESVEQVLLEAMKAFPSQASCVYEPISPTTAQFIAAMQACPYPDFDIEPARDAMPVSDPVRF